MDLPSIRDAFNRVAKKQKVWYGKTHENVDKVLDAITDAITELSKVPEEALGVDHKSVMEVLQVLFELPTLILYQEVLCMILGFCSKLSTLAALQRDWTSFLFRGFE